MRLATILKILVVLLIAVVVGGVVVLMTMDFNQYKGLIAEKVKAATGRELQIDGDIKLALSLSPTLAVNGVKFQNAPWGSQPHMAVIDRFEAQVALIPLLSKRIEVNYVVLKDADFLIERNKEGRANYEFETAGAEAQAPKAPETPAPAGGGDAAAVQLPLVHKVKIENATLTYADAAAAQPLVLVLNEVTVEGKGTDDPLDVEIDGAYNKAKFGAAGQLGPAAALTDPNIPWPVNLTLEAGGSTIKVEGSIRDVAAVNGLDLKVAAEGESMAGFSDFTGGPVPPIGPYSVSTVVRGSLADTITLEQVNAKLGKSDIGGKLAVRLDGSRPAVTGGFKSSLIDLADFTGQGGGEEKGKTSPGPAAGGGAGQPAAGKPSDGRVFPDDPLPVEALNAADADISFDAKRILVQGAAVENLRLALALRNGLLKLDPVKADVSKGSIDGRLQLDGSAAKPALDTALKVTKLDLGKLLTDMDITKFLEGSVNADLNLKGAGGSVRALMGGLNGDIKAVVGEGRIKTAALDAFIGGPTQIIGKLIAGEKKEYTVLNCAVTHTEIRNGLATLKAAALDTEFARITGTGTINLATEALEVAVVPKPKSATLNLAVGVKVGGTLADPSYRLDELSALRKLGGTVLGFGFPPALLLGLGEMGADSDNPCLKPDQGESGQAPAPSGQNPIDRAREGVGDTLKGLFGK